jgi:anti-sigma regulatory factor (Ser/Thr protein kinase)
LECDVRDFGRQVDPSTIRSRSLDEVRPGGLGVHIIRSVMDEVEYSRAEGGGMRLRMLKYLPRGAADSAAKEQAASGREKG